VHLDGVPLPSSGTTVELAGVRHSVDDLPALDDHWWHVLDSGRVRVDVGGAAPTRGRHTVEVLMGTRIPYLVGPDGQAVVLVDRARADVSP
jgi:hypothetical protein